MQSVTEHTATACQSGPGKDINNLMRLWGPRGPGSFNGLQTSPRVTWDKTGTARPGVARVREPMQSSRQNTIIAQFYELLNLNIY